ncbi:MAG: hypothetical protein K8J08_10390 [Thermoanaerobaculia bacterium]|nr:hypothetical protein [Thermoanaerobaculia bacterium]
MSTIKLKFLRSLAMAILLALVTNSATVASPRIVGDANSDGHFDAMDLLFTINQLRRGLERPNERADVARPCDGLLRSSDGLRLFGALLVEPGVPVSSECHHAVIGDPVPPPPKHPRRPPSMDDLLRKVSLRAPEFGGLYLEGGQLRVVLTESSTSSLDRALFTIQRVFGSDRFDVSSVQPVSGTYGFRSLLAWRDRAEPLLANGTITLLDADERLNRVRIGLRDMTDEPAVLAALDGLIPVGALLFEKRQPMQLEADPLTNALGERQRPLIGGLMVATSTSACTLGFMAKRYGVRGFVTNSHCLQPMGQVNGRDLFQPLPATEDVVGFELVDPPFGCGGSCRSSDAAFVALDEDITGHIGWIAGAPGTYPPYTYYGHYEVTGKDVALCGEKIRRVDPQNGEQEGDVTGTCVGMLAGTSGVSGAPAVTELSCQTSYEIPASNGGSSGAPVFRVVPNTSQAQLLGVHWGSVDGEAGFSPIANIEWQMGNLDVTVVDEVPEVEIVQPVDGSNIGGGAFPVVHLEAEVFDFEFGDTCSGCSVSWYSGKDGPLGSTAWSAGLSELDVVLGGGPGYRAITATAQDITGSTAWDTVVVSTGNSAPALWIDWPSNGFSLYRNIPYSFQGSSFDPELFHALPCADLTWTVQGPSGASFPVAGCLATVTFENVGTHTVTLTGEDPSHLSGTASVTFDVINPGPTSPPIVTFLSPAPNSGSAPGTLVTVTAQVTNPNGGNHNINWAITTPGRPQVGLGSGTVPSGGTRSLTLRPSDYVIPSCGAVSYTIVLQATGVGGGPSGFGYLPLSVIWPPC